jgi:Xaa-Pro aminopeptidase
MILSGLMKHYIKMLFLVLIPLLFSIESFSQSAFKLHERRTKLISQLDSNSAAVLKAAEGKTKANDVPYPYHQESNFLYLTGIKAPGNYLLLIPQGTEIDGKKINTIFLGTGILGDSINLSENELILNTDRLKDIFNSILPSLTTLYISAPDLGFINDWLNNKRYYIDKDARKELENKFPNLKVKSISGLAAKLREIKSETELKLIQKAIDITGDGFKRTMPNCKPGMYEYELQAEIEFETTRQGAECEGFSSIVGSGPNSHILHYDKNRRQMKAGDLVVMDVGAEYNGYSADITRTIPVSGKFTKAQREIYELILNIQKDIFKIIKPGLALKEIDNQFKILVSEKGYKKYIKHGITHHIGLDVHDVWWSDTLTPGMVITVEPGLYIPEDDKEIDEKYRGIAIRIEDDVLITNIGSVVLSKNIPKEIDDIETYMRAKK